MVRQRKSTLLLVPLLILLTGSRIYGAATYAGSTITIPADGDSPYTFSDIAEDIGDPSVFSYDAVSCIATCTAHLSISGTVHMGKVAADGSYNAGGNEETLKITDTTSAAPTYTITVNNGGTFIARGTEGTVGTRRTSADTLSNYITSVSHTYGYMYGIKVNQGGLIKLYDTKVDYSATASGGAGIWIDSNFDIQRCQIYAYTYYAVAVWFGRYYTTPKVFRDNYIGCRGSGSTKNRISLFWSWGGGYNANMDVINCEFDSGSYGVYCGYYQGIRIIDCKFSYSVGAINSYASGVGQVELRNCDFCGSRSFSFGGEGHASEYALFKWYLGEHVVNKNNLDNIDTGDNDITIEEKDGTNTIYKFIDGLWASPTSSITIGTDATGWTPAPTNDGAIMLTEMIQKRVTYGGTKYYYYNLKVAEQAASRYLAYDYYEQHGGNYITSVDEGGVTNDRCIGPGWFRQDAAAPNSEPLLNEPPTNGTWYVGMQPISSRTLFRLY